MPHDVMTSYDAAGIETTFVLGQRSHRHKFPQVIARSALGLRVPYQKGLKMHDWQFVAPCTTFNGVPDVTCMELLRVFR